MRVTQHHGTSLRHDFKNPFLQEENTRDKSFQFFKFISPTIGTWTQRKHDPSLVYIDYDENLRGRSRSWDQIVPQQSLHTTRFAVQRMSKKRLTQEGEVMKRRGLGLVLALTNHEETFR